MRATGPFSDGSASRQHKLSHSCNSSFNTHSHSPSPTVTSRASPHSLQSQYCSSSPKGRQLQSQYHSPSPIVQQFQTQYHSTAISPQPQSYPNVARPPGSTRRRLTWTGTSSADLKWHKLTAMVKGFLTRRLLHCHKVQGLVKTIKVIINSCVKMLTVVQQTILIAFCGPWGMILVGNHYSMLCVTRHNFGGRSQMCLSNRIPPVFFSHLMMAVHLRMMWSCTNVLTCRYLHRHNYIIHFVKPFSIHMYFCVHSFRLHVLIYTRSSLNHRLLIEWDILLTQGY